MGWVSTLNVEALVLALARHRVRYALSGTLGAIVYGADLVARDKDICPATDAVTQRNLADLLTEWGANPRKVLGYTDDAACDSWISEPPFERGLDPHVYRKGPESPLASARG